MLTYFSIHTYADDSRRGILYFTAVLLSHLISYPPTAEQRPVHGRFWFWSELVKFIQNFVHCSFIFLQYKNSEIGPRFLTLVALGVPFPGPMAIHLYALTDAFSS